MNLNIFNIEQGEILKIEKPPPKADFKTSETEIKEMSSNQWGITTGMNLIGVSLYLSLIGLIITALFRKNKSGLLRGVIGLVIAVMVFKIIRVKYSI